MWLNLKKIFLCFIVLQIFGQLNQVECKSVRRRSKGRGKAFVGGMAAGSLAAAAASHLLNRNDKPTEIHTYHIAGVPPSFSNPVNPNPNPIYIPPKQVTTIEKGPTLPNGCYKQTVKEPHPSDSTRFIETEQLICPQPNPPVQMVPVVAIAQPQPTVPAIHMSQVPVQIEPAKPQEKINIHPAPAPVYTAPLQPLQPNFSVAVQTPTNNTGYVPAAVHPAQAINPAPTAPPPVQTPTNNVRYVPVAAVHPVQPINPAPIAAPPVQGYVPVASVHPVQPINPAPTSPPQVIVISKITGSYLDDKKKKKNAAKSLFENNNFAVLLPLLVVLRFF